MSDSVLITLFCVLYAATVVSTFLLMAGPKAARVRWQSYKRETEPDDYGPL
jgi:hypothetical protein